MKTKKEGHFFQVPNNFWEQTKEWGHLERHIFLYLASKCYGEKNVCWPSQERIAEDTGISLKAIKTNLSQLVERGAIEIKRASEFDNEADLRQRAYILINWFSLATTKSIVKKSHQKKVGAPNTPKSRCPEYPQFGAPFTPSLVPQRATKKTTEEDNSIRKKERNASEFDDTSKTEQTEAMITTEAQGKQGEGDETSKHTDTKDSAKKRLIAKISSWMENFGFNASDRQQSAFAESGITEAQLQSIYDNIQHWGRWVSELNKKLDNKVDGSLTIMQKNYHKFLRWLEPEEKALSYEEQEKIKINLKQSVKRLCEENGIWDQDECWKWVNDNNNVPWIEDKMDYVQNLWVSRFNLTIKDGKLAFGHDILTKDQIKSLSKDNIQATVRKINGEVRK